MCSKFWRADRWWLLLWNFWMNLYCGVIWATVVIFCLRVFWNVKVVCRKKPSVSVAYLQCYGTYVSSVIVTFHYTHTLKIIHHWQLTFIADIAQRPLFFFFLWVSENGRVQEFLRQDEWISFFFLATYTPYRRWTFYILESVRPRRRCVEHIKHYRCNFCRAFPFFELFCKQLWHGRRRGKLRTRPALRWRVNTYIQLTRSGWRAPGGVKEKHGYLGSRSVVCSVYWFVQPAQLPLDVRRSRHDVARASELQRRTFTLSRRNSGCLLFFLNSKKEREGGGRGFNFHVLSDFSLSLFFWWWDLTIPPPMCR